MTYKHMEDILGSLSPSLTEYNGISTLKVYDSNFDPFRSLNIDDLDYTMPFGTEYYEYNDGFLIKSYQDIFVSKRYYYIGASLSQESERKMVKRSDVLPRWTRIVEEFQRPKEFRNWKVYKFGNRSLICKPDGTAMSTSDEMSIGSQVSESNLRELIHFLVDRYLTLDSKVYFGNNHLTIHYHDYKVVIGENGGFLIHKYCTSDGTPYVESEMKSRVIKVLNKCIDKYIEHALSS